MIKKIKKFPAIYLFYFGLIIISLIASYYLSASDYLTNRIEFFEGWNNLLNFSIPTYNTGLIDYYIYTFLAVIVFWFLPSKYRFYWLASYSTFIILSWDIFYLSMLVVITLFSFLMARQISKTIISKKRIQLFRIALFGCVFFLLGFKLINVFFRYLTINLTFSLPDILLPLGISYYTFQAISYIIDVNSGKFQFEQKFLDYYLYMAFFPRFVSGPIERATEFIKQIKTPKSFDYDFFISGLRQILWGLFIKSVISARLQVISDYVFDRVSGSSSSEAWVGVLAFSFFIYFDFYAYTNIALGTAKLFGISLTNNFNKPYLSESIVDFWRRWHISFSSWLRDYIFLPLEFSTRRIQNRSVKYLNIIITFIISGIWHGTSLNYLIWGGLHGLYQVIEDIFGNTVKKITKNDTYSSLLGKPGRILITFFAVTIAWVFFRGTVGSGLYLLNTMFRFENFFNFSFDNIGISSADFYLLLIILLIFSILNLIDFKRDFLEVLSEQRFLFRLIFCLFLATVTILFAYRTGGNTSMFIYAEF